MILAIGNSTNYEHDSFIKVRDALRRHNNDALLFCQDKCLSGSYLTYHLEDGQMTYFISIDGEKYNVNDFDAIWYIKPHLPKSLREHSNHEYRTFIHRQFRCLRESIWQTFASKQWLNDPQKMFRAENKPLQLDIASQVGLSVPDTIITSDPDAVKDFCDKGDAIIKVLEASPLPNRVIYTNSLGKASLEGLDRLRFSPAIVQRAVPKQYELRITIVADKIFAARINSQDDPDTSIDWRKKPLYNDFDISIQETTLPKHVDQSLRKYMQALGLTYGCVDMIVTPDNEYVFLEINPNGQWYFIQQRTSYEIADSIAEVLHAPQK